MKADSPHWKVMGPPATPEEDAALEAFRKVLPDDGRTTAWVNLTFIDTNNRTAEVDVLLLTPVGFFCVELKGWHGTITGDSQRWYQPGKTHANPFLVTDRKGKRLASLLKSYASSPHMERSVPWVNALVVLHGQGSTFAVDPSGRAGVVKLDGYNVTSKPPLQSLSEFLATPPANPRDLIDPQRTQLVRHLCDKADFRPTPKTRMVGDYVVADSDPVAEGVDWQDVVVTHPNLTKIKQRLRLYDVPPKASVSERKRIEQLAQREYQLTFGIRHEGIAVPQQFLVTDDGPALVFEYQEAERSLDAFLDDEEGNLTLDDRVAMVEQLGDILRFAHNRHLFHRALSPQRVWVRPSFNGPRLEVRDWYSAQKDRETANSTSWTVISRGVTDLLGVTGAEDLVWLAPEARQSVTEVPGAPLDIFGFGALAFLILTGKAPAMTIVEVQELQQQAGRFDPRTVTAALPDTLSEVVGDLTSVDEEARPASMEDALELIRIAWAEVRRPDDQAPPEEIADPLDAQTGDMIGERFLVAGRRGEGSSGIALAVLDDAAGDDREFILKVARDDAAGRRLDAEAEVLGGLEHPRVVRLVERLELGGRNVLLMSDAGKETLASRLVKEGQSTLEQLQRWGTDLLEAMAYLVDVKGVFHRDIKPANLGIAPDPAYRKPHLTLFDFSLAREPLENIASGTPGYLDPFLGKGRRIRYDRAAELWAVSATLFEMATGVLPWWPNGGSAPVNAADRPVVEPTSFDPAVGAPLAELFRKALSPDVKERFGNVEDLLRAWVDVFASLALDVDARQKDDELASRVTLETSLEESGLSAHALSALRRLDGIVTVGDVLGVHPVKINGIRGLGETYRKEIQARIAQWRTGLRHTDAVPGVEVALGVDRVVDTLIEMLPAADKSLAHSVLGLGDAVPWPTAAEIAASFQTTRERVIGMLDDAVGEWSKVKPFIAARSELTNIVANAARVMTVAEAVAAIVTLRGSTLDGAQRTSYGTALVRAIVEFDARDTEPQFVLRRRAGAKGDLLALNEDAAASDDGGAAPSSDLLTELAGELGSKADDLVAGGVAAASAAITALRGVVKDLDGDSQWQVTDARLLRLAAAASQTAAVSGFQELYPRALPVKEALEHAMRGKPGRSISETAVRRTLSARFPHLTEPPPSSDRLNTLMRELYPELVSSNGVYAPKSTVLYSTGTVSTTQFAATPVAEVTRKLTESLSRRSALTLTVAPKRYLATVRTLASQFDIEVVDVAGLVISSTKEQIEEAGGIWSGLLGYDALDRDSKQWKALEGVVQKSVQPVWEDWLSSNRPLLLTNAGPLVRYGMTSLLATLLDTGTKRPAARWLLVAKAGDARAPLLEGRSVPLGPSGWIDLPRDITQLANDEALKPHHTNPTGDHA
ncbi:BREX system serine/threonine kinase PglW [Paenarthrobacter sp. YJN-5]|uniref:BREX system serine/threonine kinase PglW n=1 Tax=Paenarthrobacter sp. YJN-5 TaxID=2735316 RepID=UPI0018786CB0|nr:BREX system serine/threonine kinase PglW [Paenarthrobacter sp. YJN-5]QOT17924.1 BREX system serine/threonine kinase PglW [Paenarthrobacter sp. YJN-5]